VRHWQCGARRGDAAAAAVTVPPAGRVLSADELVEGRDGEGLEGVVAEVEAAGIGVLQDWSWLKARLRVVRLTRSKRLGRAVRRL
jgi:hypothetical protein